MLRDILGKLSASGDDKVILPSMDRPKPEKSIRVDVFEAENPRDLKAIRPKLDESPLIFINVENLMGEEKKSFINRLKVMGSQFDMDVYGLDTSWIFITRYKVQ